MLTPHGNKGADMSFVESVRSADVARRRWPVFALIGLAAFSFWQPDAVWETAAFVLAGLVSITPIVVPGILLAAWVIASGASDKVADIFQGKTLQTVLVASLVGALTPVCGVTVLPLMAGLLAAGIPLAPVMAFWLSSPITDPAMLSTTLATLGWEFGVGKTVAAVGLGLFGGLSTAALAKTVWAKSPLRSNGLVGSLGNGCAGCASGTAAFDPWVWRDANRRTRFFQQLAATTRLMLIVLTPAFAAEYWLNVWLTPGAFAGYVGQESPFAIPLAVLVGGPAYIDGYAALPLTRVLMDHGMSPGAAMAFLISGGVVSIWGALAIFPVLRLRPFLLYLLLALSGSMLSGWVFGALS